MTAVQLDHPLWLPCLLDLAFSQAVSAFTWAMPQH